MSDASNIEIEIRNNSSVDVADVVDDYAAEQARQYKEEARQYAENAQNSQNMAEAWAESSDAPAGEGTRSGKTWADVARQWAESDSEPDQVEGAKSSKSWAEEAAQSASAAAASETNALKEEQASASSAKSAAESETAAKTAKEDAEKSAENAKSSAEAAALSETNAGASRDAAQTSASAAQASALAAATSEANAGIASNSASSSASAAKNSETASASSASAAAVSESHAALSETNAAASLAQAKEIEQGITQKLGTLGSAARYCGSRDSFSELPTTGQSAGDIYNIVNGDPENNVKAGDNVIWNGEVWDNLSGFVDLSDYAKTSDLPNALVDVTYAGANISFVHKDGTTTSVTVNNVQKAGTADVADKATADGNGNNIASTYATQASAQSLATNAKNSALSGVPNVQITTPRSDQADLTVTYRQASMKTYRGIAAGTYSLGNLLQRLARLSHSHATSDCNCNCDCDCDCGDSDG